MTKHAPYKVYLNWISPFHSYHTDQQQHQHTNKIATQPLEHINGTSLQHRKPGCYSYYFTFTHSSSENNESSLGKCMNLLGIYQEESQVDILTMEYIQIFSLRKPFLHFVQSYYFMATDKPNPEPNSKSDGPMWPSKDTYELIIYRPRGRKKGCNNLVFWQKHDISM